MTLRNVARWAVLLVALLVAAIYLNSAAFSAWVASGPPTPFPEVWAQRSLAHACTAASILLAGISSFLAIKAFPRIGWIPILFGFLAIALAAVPVGREFMLIDSCLDSGGRWDEQEFRCRQ
jgi:hypothetical protein